MPKLMELSDKQLNTQIKKYSDVMDSGAPTPLDRKKLKALVGEKKKRKPTKSFTSKKSVKKDKKNSHKQAALGKVRNPWVVMLLMIITFGIYGLVYIYKTASEIHRYRKTGLSGIAMLIISIIPLGGLVTIFLLPKYIKALHRENGKSCSLNGYYGALAFIPFGIIVLIHMQQSRLNEFWKSTSRS